MKAETLVKVGRASTLITPLIGILILGAYALTLRTDFAFAGFYFFWIAGIINLIIFVTLITNAAIDPKARKKLLLTAALLLINLPISVMCFAEGFKLANTFRLHLRNNTKSVVTNILLTGCHNKQIGKMQPGEEKNVIIEIPGDCSLLITYLKEGKKQTEVVEGYLTNAGGGTAAYNIGGPNERH